MTARPDIDLRRMLTGIFPAVCFVMYQIKRSDESNTLTEMDIFGTLYAFSAKGDKFCNFLFALL